MGRAMGRVRGTAGGRVRARGRVRGGATGRGRGGGRVRVSAVHHGDYQHARLGNLLVLGHAEAAPGKGGKGGAHTVRESVS